VELKHLQTFRTVAQELSFTRAAEKLMYAQSSVTQQIQALEDELGTPLFERLGRRVLLTERGHLLLTYADKLLAMATEARTMVSGEATPSGTLTIGAAESLCLYRLIDMLQEYRHHYPNVQLVIRSALCAEMRRSVQRGEIDIVLTIEPPTRTESLVTETLFEETMLLLVSPDHPLVDKERVEPADLHGEAFVMTELGCSYRAYLDHVFEDNGVLPSGRLEFFSIELIKKCTRSGLGITLLPEMCVRDELAAGTLVPLRWSGPPFAMHTQVSWHRDRWVSPAMRAFLQVLTELG